MKHIIIYGPPASGKLSIAGELAKLSGFSLLSNQTSIRMVREVFDFGHPEFTRLVVRFRTELLEAASNSGVDGVISTLVYAKPGDDEILKNWIAAVQRHRGQTHFVRLITDEKTLLKRAPKRSKRLHRKLVSISKIRDLLHRMDLTSAIPFVKSLEIDTTRTKPRRAALKIKHAYSL